MESTLPLETPSTVSTTSPASLSSDSQGERRTSVSSANQENKDKDRITVPSACVGCRSKHLKCDGLNPCTRCTSNAVECVYVRSRRGFKGPRRNGATKALSVSGNGTATVLTPPHACPLVHPGGASSSRNSSSVPIEQVLKLDSVDHSLLFDASQELVSFDSKQLPSGLDIRERCIEAFFYHFYPAHPFLLPRGRFMAFRKERPLPHLEAAMRYVGSFYVAQAPTVAYGLEAERSVYHMDCHRDGFWVQAMLILVIGLDGYIYQEKALQILIDAQNVALDLGMNKREYATLNGSGSDVIEESWRRTWWEMYVVDGMIAGVHQRSSFRMNEMLSDVTLPCEEKEYLNGVIPMPRSLQDFDDEPFDEREFTFSSFTYRIAAVRNLGRVLKSLTVLDEATIHRIDAYLVNWKLHLPDLKKTFISSDGYLDEMIFQAHMISEATTILLHREHSQLDSSVAQHVTSCAPHKSIMPGESYNVHASKTIQAAQDISKLITLPVPLARHTHFFTCVVTLASIVHLSCWSVLLPIIQDDDLKQQLRLNTGALKSLWQVWPSAGQAFRQVKGVAQEIFSAKKHAAEVGYWTNLSNDEVMRSMIADQSIMEELQLL